MKLLKDYITTYGEVPNDDILKVDAFLNHQIDADLMMKLAEDICAHFAHCSFTKVVTIETSGIAPSVFLGYLLKVPVVFMKKGTSNIMNNRFYHTTVHSFTKNIDYELLCSKNYITKEDHVLFVDDFMANGEACLGAIKIIEEANASLDGIAIVIEKAFQEGRKKVAQAGYDIYSQARIATLKDGQVHFVEDEN